MYKDRVDAALLLAKKLIPYKDTNSVILAIPRGGVPLGYILSQQLNLPLEVVLSKKIGHPLHREFAIGAVTLTSRKLSDAAAEVPAVYIEEETKRIREKLGKRYEEYYGDKEPTPLKGKTLIIVDDGIATGNTMLSIIEMLHEEKAAKIVVAIPVAPYSAIKKFKKFTMIDEVICPLVPDYFRAVGQFYQNFDQVEDHKVKQLLQQASLGSSN